MQTIGPYRLLEMLGRCDIGVVWSAVDPEGQLVSVAILDASAASDQRWRDAFIVTASALARQEDDRLPIVSADYTALTPWVAAVAEPGVGVAQIFLALGVDYQTAAEVDRGPARSLFSAGADVAPPEPASTPQAPAGSDPFAAGDGHETLGDPEVTQRAEPRVSPSGADPSQSVLAPLVPDSSPPQPVSAPPAAIPPPPQPFSFPLQPVPMSRVLVPTPRPAPLVEPRRRRTRLWIGVVLLVMLLLAGGAAVYAWKGLAGSARPTSRSSSSEPLALPTPPVSPGLEPPTPGTWPPDWPKFIATDKVKTLTGLEGLGFALKVPLDWQCNLAERAQGFVKYNCGSAVTGGELIVRGCPQPCAEDQQSAMRRGEEAWGAQWVRCGQYCALAEKLVQVNGQQRHALAVVAYWRSGSEARIDRQLVFRMTAPLSESYQLRQVASYLRDALIF
jgi:hypothetical protein